MSYGDVPVSIVKVSNGEWVTDERQERINVLNVPKSAGLASLKADGTDETAKIQAIIDHYAATQSNVGGKTVFFPKVPNGYNAVKVGFRHGVSIESDGAVFNPVTSSEPDFFYVAEDGPIKYCSYSGFNLSYNPANPTQNGMNLLAKAEVGGTDHTGGVWDCKFSDIRITDFGGVGLRIHCDDTSDAFSNDMANQFSRFKHIRVFRNSATAKCLEITGQLGQTVFEDCQFDGNSQTLGGVSVDLISLATGNDQIIAPLKFDNVTMQMAQSPLRTNNVNIVLDTCYFENTQKAITLTNNSMAMIDSCIFSDAGSDGLGGGYLVQAGSSCIVKGDGNRILGAYDVAIALDNVSNTHSGIDCKFSVYSTTPNLKLANTTPNVVPAAGVMNARNYRSAFTISSADISLTTINSSHSESEQFIIRKWGTGTLNVTTGGNIILPNGVTNIALKQNDTIAFMKTSPIGLTTQWVVLFHQGIET